MRHGLRRGRRGRHDPVLEVAELLTSSVITTMDLIEVDILLDWILWYISVGAAVTAAVVVLRWK
jgi:hypothetical protein